MISGSRILFFTKYYPDVKNKKGMGGAYATEDGGELRCMEEFRMET